MNAKNGFLIIVRSAKVLDGKEYKRFVDTEAMVKVIAEETIKRDADPTGNPTEVIVIPAVRYMA